MLAHYLRLVLLGAAVGVGLLLVTEHASEGKALPVVAGGVLLLVVAMGVQRWLTRRRSKRQPDDTDPS